MLAMLRKDFYVMGKYTVTMLVIWALMAGMYALVPGVDGNMFYAIMPVMASTLALNAIANDRACRWDQFAAMTPLRPWQLVLEKYLLAYGLTALLGVLSALAGWISTADPNALNIWVVVVMVFLSNTMGIPLVYRFGRQRGATVLLLIWGVTAAVVLGTAHWRRELLSRAFGWMEYVSFPVLMAGTAAGLLMISMVSVPLSIRFYARRQRGMYD